jgi:hypothetical protein
MMNRKPGRQISPRWRRIRKKLRRMLKGRL